MANLPNKQGVMNDRNHEDKVITQAEFRAFQRETQQALQAIQATLARLTTGNNQRREEERVHENYRERFNLAREHNPAPRRQLAYEEEHQQREEERVHENYRERFHPAREHNPPPRRHLAYEEELSDDEEFAERILRPNRQGYHNMGGREPQAFRMKMDLPSFNGQLQIEGFLDWLAVVERFFDYMDIPEDKKVKLANGRSLGLVGTALADPNEAKKGYGSILDQDEAFATVQQYQDCRQGSRTVQAYVEEFNRLSSRNNLSETDAQQVARFVGGLRLNVQDRVSMHTIYSLTEAINLATKAETQLERARSTGVVRPPFEPRQGFPTTAA
uniref:Retrotransposon gag domain-containing protein n=1 Tax=Salix viminalis TaxID=40686 RepID=A0A6N2MPZ8_SALVM